MDSVSIHTLNHSGAHLVRVMLQPGETKVQAYYRYLRLQFTLSREELSQICDIGFIPEPSIGRH